jgi:hypothetical protein
MSLLSQQDYFLTWSIFFLIKTFELTLGHVKILVKAVEIVEIVEFYQDCQDLLSFVKIYQDFLTFSRLFEGLQDQKSQQIEKSRSR